MVKEELHEHDGKIMDPMVHEVVRDASMLGLAFGHVMLVARLTLVRSLKSLRYASQACTMEGCVGMECKGNRLEEVPNPSFPSTSMGSTNASFNMSLEHSKSLFKLCCAHHKNSGRGVHGFEVVINSTQLHALLVVYEGSSRKFLLRRLFLEVEDEPSTLFFSLTNGSPLSPKQLDAWFKSLQVKHDLSLAHLPMPQSTLRRIFTSDRREHPHLQGPCDMGASLGMGNSPKVSGRDLSLACREMLGSLHCFLSCHSLLLT